ncbi:hypothetical protein BC829DRAFT_441138 [Chytridium lagenaria]|nr:hypothetical protein BC829DRAFT_441138 [Chytridium lagenaria]
MVRDGCSYCGSSQWLTSSDDAKHWGKLICGSCLAGLSDDGNNSQDSEYSLPTNDADTEIDPDDTEDEDDLWLQNSASNHAHYNHSVYPDSVLRSYHLFAETSTEAVADLITPPTIVPSSATFNWDADQPNPPSIWSDTAARRPGHPPRIPISEFPSYNHAISTIPDVLPHIHHANCSCCLHRDCNQLGEEYMRSLLTMPCAFCAHITVFKDMVEHRMRDVDSGSECGLVMFSCLGCAQALDREVKKFLACTRCGESVASGMYHGVGLDPLGRDVAVCMSCMDRRQSAIDR